ncbi:unnamed protein product [Laminaria digitata]
MWWCPWIHDLGLMAGCVRHGFMNINAMRSDTTLPLHPSSVQDHITRALIVGVEDPMSHMDEDFPTAGAVQAWAEESSSEFPTRRSAEERVFRICVALTKLMPLSNPLRVRCYNERWA